MRKTMLAALLVAAAALGACATHQVKSEVDAVVIDENARATAAAVAERTADSKDALKAADDVSTREPATPR